MDVEVSVEMDVKVSVEVDFEVSVEGDVEVSMEAVVEVGISPARVLHSARDCRLGWFRDGSDGAILLLRLLLRVGYVEKA